MTKYHKYLTGVCEHCDTLLEHRIMIYNSHIGAHLPQVGEFVQFNDGILRRITYLWKYGEHGRVLPVDEWGIQTGDVDSGSYYFGKGYVSYSGSLYISVKGKHLKGTSRTLDGRVWFFHRDWWEADNGVNYLAPFKLWIADCDAPEV